MGGLYDKEKQAFSTQAGYGHEDSVSCCLYAPCICFGRVYGVEVFALQCLAMRARARRGREKVGHKALTVRNDSSDAHKRPHKSLPHTTHSMSCLFKYRSILMHRSQSLVVYRCCTCSLYHQPPARFFSPHATALLATTTTHRAHETTSTMHPHSLLPGCLLLLIVSCLLLTAQAQVRFWAKMERGKEGEALHPRRRDLLWIPSHPTRVHSLTLPL